MTRTLWQKRSTCLKIGSTRGTLVSDIVGCGSAWNWTTGTNFAEYNENLSSSCPTYLLLRQTSFHIWRQLQTTKHSPSFKRLQASDTAAYGQGILPDSDLINCYLNKMQDYYYYQAFEWLFPSEFSLCSDSKWNVDSASCVSDGISFKSNPFPLVPATLMYRSCGAAGCSARSPRGSDTCPDNEYTWFCIPSNPRQYADPTCYSVLNSIDSNSYVKQKNLYDGNFSSWWINGCNGFDLSSSVVVTTLTATWLWTFRFSPRLSQWETSLWGLFYAWQLD